MKPIKRKLAFFTFDREIWEPKHYLLDQKIELPNPTQQKMYLLLKKVLFVSLALINFQLGATPPVPFEKRKSIIALL
jgi:hypothetical protein